MKTISKRFLKRGLALLLAFVMLFGTTITGFAAVVDNAETSETPINEGDVIWFTNPDSWSKVNIHVWGGTSGSSTWPGKAMKKDATTNYYYWESDGNYANCIFNNGSTQTGDLTIPGPGYSYGDSWSSEPYSNVVPVQPVTNGELISVLKNEKIMFYIGQPTSWTNSVSGWLYLKDGSTEVYYTQGKFTYSNYHYAPVCAEKKTGYQVSNKKTWEGTEIDTTPVPGGAYGADGKTTVSATYAVSATLSSDSIQVGTDATIASSTKSSGNLGRTTQYQYYYTTDNSTFYQLDYSDTTLDTSSLATGTYTIYPVLYDGYVYVRGDAITLSVTSGYSYTVSAGAGGSVSPSGTQSGTTATVVATPDDGYKFAGWDVSDGAEQNGETTIDDDGVATGNFTITANNATIEATFTKKTYTISTSVSPAGAGTATVNNKAEDTVTHGEEVSLKAVANPGYVFIGWYLDGKKVSDAADYSPTATADAKYTAKFADEYVVSAVDPLPDGIESIEIEPTKVADGGSVDVTATVKTGYRFDGWTVTGTADCTDKSKESITLSNIKSNITVTPKVVKTYTVKYSVYTNRLSYSSGTVTINNSTTNSQTFDAGTKVTLVASSTTRKFYGWYDKSDTNFEGVPRTESTYTIDSLDEDIDVVAMFYRPFTIVGDVPGDTVELDYDIVKDQYTGSSNDYKGNTFNIKDTFNAVVTHAQVNPLHTDHVGAGVGGMYSSNYTLSPKEGYNPNATIKYTLNSSGSGNYKLIIELTPAKKVTINVNGTEIEKAVGTEFSYKITAPDGQYLDNSTTVTPPQDFSIVDDTIKFIVPDVDETIFITPSFSYYSYVEIPKSDVFSVTGLKSGYMAGETAVITLTPTAGTSIKSITATKDGVAFENFTFANGELTIPSVPADSTITFAVETESSFTMDYEHKSIGNYGTGVASGFGTVTMTIGDTTLAKGGYAGPSDTVKYTATESNENYVFAGFYSDADCENLLTYDSTYSCKPSANTTVYALWARRQWMDFDSGSANYVNELVYSKTERVYKLSTVIADKSSQSAVSYKAWFQVTNDKNSWTTNPSYHNYGSDFSVTYNTYAVDATVERNNTTSWKLSTESNNVEKGITFILTPTGNTAIDFSAQVGDLGDIIYLSSGRLDITGARNTTLFDADSVFTTEGLNTPSSHEVKNDKDKELREKYKKLMLAEDQTISFQTTLSGSQAGNYYIENYVVYFIEDQTFEIVEPVSKGNNVYEGSVFVDGPCYICPIYFRTEAYATANELAQINIYFDASAIKDKPWGPFVACYAWGTGTDAEYFGGWSGQMMIPTADGKSFYTMLTVPKATATNPASGVTFNNYMQATCAGDNYKAFGISNTQYQCYDYREPITLYEGGYDVITFVAKTSKDGYHGEGKFSDGSATKLEVTASTTNVKTRYKFDYLYSRDGETPMDFNGDTIENATKVEGALNADYYVVSKGDVEINVNGYAGDTSYNGNWSVEWYIFDKDGNYKTTVLSTAMWHDKDNNLETLNTYLHDALTTDKDGLAGKLVAISYEAPNKCPQNNTWKDKKSHQVSYDGQWYGNYLQDKVKGEVKVGLKVGDDFQIDSDDKPNQAAYGEAYLLDSEGGRHQNLEITIDYGRADITAKAIGEYLFVGWYTLQPDGSYKQISTSLTDNPYINMNETYYAIFREIEDGTFVINHLAYNNNDQHIPSHGGTAELMVEIYDSNNVCVAKGSPDHKNSSASYLGDETEEFTIRITTTPLMNGKFYAWYTDSTNADGSKTYEEVFTRDDVIESTSTVVAEFKYKYSKERAIINIYSDVIKVTNKADIRFKYQNRFNEPKIYTVKDIVLTDQECEGYEGNGYKTYTPTYLTAYTMSKKGADDVVVYGEKARKAKEDEGYTMMGSVNNISQYVPNSDVTEVFNGTVVWDVVETQIKADGSIVTLEAVQGKPKYIINYTMGNDNGSVEDYYNELIEITAPTTYNGKDFTYWYEPATGEILTYSIFYNYRIVENKTITAVYGATDLKEWVPSINSIVNTREYSDNSDYIYTDHLLAFNNVKGLVLRDEMLSNEKVTYDYGLMVLRNANYYIDEETTTVEYPDTTNPDVISRLKTIASVRQKNSGFTVDGIKYNCYFYKLTGKPLTNFNRMNFYVQYDNKLNVDETHYYREFALTSVAYLVVTTKADDGTENKTVYLSNPKNTNFYELGNESVQDNTN